MRKLILPFLLLLLLLCACARQEEQPVSSNQDGLSEGQPEESSPPPEETEPPEPEPIVATLTVAGDVMNHNTQISDAYDAATGTYDYSHVFQYV